MGLACPPTLVQDADRYARRHHGIGADNLESARAEARRPYGPEVLAFTGIGERQARTIHRHERMLLASHAPCGRHSHRPTDFRRGHAGTLEQVVSALPFRTRPI